MRITIDPSNDKPITVQEDDGGFKTYDVLNVLDRQGNTVGQIVVENGQIVVKGTNLYPSTSNSTKQHPQTRRGRTNRPCGCLGA